MTLLNPLGLLGLFSLPVILALHLLFQRQQQHIVSSLEPWSFLDTRALGPQARRIPLTWILLVDLMVGLLFSLAWAQPRVAIAMPMHAPRQLVILLDVSTSMLAKSGTGQAGRLTQAKHEVTALLDGVQSQDVVTIIGFGRQARLIADSRQNNLAYLQEQVNSLQAGETGSVLQEALALGQASLDRQLMAEFHVITDGDFSLENAGDLSAFAYPLHWHIVGEPVDNQAVVDLNATPLETSRLQVFARIANFGSHAVSREAILEVDGRLIDQASIDLPAGSSIPRVWQIPSGTAQKPTEVTVTLRGEDALSADDSASISLQTGGTVRVALVTGSPAAFQRVLQAIPGVDAKIIEPAAYASTLANEGSPFDLTIFDQFLPQKWPGGHVLVVDPPAETGSGSVSLLARSTREIPADAFVQTPNPDPVIDGIDFNGVRWARAWSLANPPPGFIPLLQANDVPVLLRGEMVEAQSGPSQVVVLLADLSRGNFTKHAAFPVLMANLVENARQAPMPSGFQTGEPLQLPDPGSYRSIQITPPGQARIDLGPNWPAQWIQTLEPGLYHFRFIRADGGIDQFSAGARAGDTLESDLQTRGWAQSIRAGTVSPEPPAAPITQQVDLRVWLLGAGMLFLVLEAALAWHR